MSISGRVLLGGRDTVPLAHVWVALHHVTREGGGPLDSMRTDANGRYRILLRQPDSAGSYVVSAWYDSIAYFSLPIALHGTTARVEDLFTYPSTTGSPPIHVSRRLATVARPRDDGTREVLEILELENAGQTTRITKDTLQPTWAGRVPAHAGQFQGGQGDISPEAIVFRNDSVHVLGPIPPGPVKQLTYGYSLPASARTFELPIDQPTKEVNLLIEDTAAVVHAPGLESLGVQSVEERRFAAYRTGPLPAGSRVVIELPHKFRAQALLPFVIAVLAAGMVVALVWALRRRPAPA